MLDPLITERGLGGFADQSPNGFSGIALSSMVYSTARRAIRRVMRRCLRVSECFDGGARGTAKAIVDSSRGRQVLDIGFVSQ